MHFKDKVGKRDTFEEFKKIHYSMWLVTLDSDDTSCSCTCPYFLKHLICKHSLGMRIRLKLVDVALEAKSVLLGQKKEERTAVESDESSFNAIIGFFSM